VKRISVRLKQNAYDVVMGRGLLARAASFIRAAMPKPSGILLVTDRNVARSCAPTLIDSLRRSKIEVHVFQLPAGEQHKNLQTLETLQRAFVRAGADRDSLVIALGGGVIGDLAGFAASVFMRGIPVVQIPTTLLAQVDASIGGKTGVNLLEGKNLVGSFHQPRLVIIDPNSLHTLPDREYRAGLYEALKCGIIRDRTLFDFMEADAEALLRREPKAVDRAIAAAVEVKADVVAADERESDLRRILNFGHTIGHALESAGNYRALLHGEAVALGMMAAAEIGVAAGITPEPVAERIVAAIASYGQLPRTRATPAQILRLIRSDKKASHGIPKFVLVKNIGQTEISSDIEAKVISRAVSSLREASQ
jgi:3-dehydroquinate synthase